MTPPPIRSRSALTIVVLGTLLLSLFFFAPRLWVLASDAAGAPQLVRARTYLAQCEQPFRKDIEAAMRWRVLPPLVAHTLGLRGKSALVLPWLGVLCATVYVARLLRSRLAEWRFVFGGTLLYTTASATLVPFGFLGFNDAWVWLGLLVVAFGRAPWALPVACLLCPWIDERQMIGFPLAWMVRCLDRREPFLSSATWSVLWFIPYIAIRLTLGGAPGNDHISVGYVFGSVKSQFLIAAMVPLGWWMGLRGAWGAVLFAAWAVPPHRRLLSGAILIATLLITWLLAADLSRSVSIVIPVVFLGCIELARRYPIEAPRLLLSLSAINLFIPAASVIYLGIDPINPLPLELYRLLR